MSTVRKQIRDAVKAALVAAGNFGSNVFIGRHDSVKSSALPCCDVYFGEAEYELISTSAGGDGNGRRYAVRRQLQCRILAKGTSSDIVEEELDTLLEAVLAAICADPTLGGVCKDLDPASDAPDIDDEGAVIIGAMVVTFEVYTEEVR